MTNAKSHIKNLPVHGWIGLGLIIVYWYANWALSGLRAHLAFFPMWLGYCLTVDALVIVRKGNSMLTRRPIAYIKLFIISAPGWWLFEVINWRTQNWFYDGRQYFTGFQYFVLASVCFSTVMPAVFGSAELVSTFDWLKHIKPWIKIPPTKTVRRAYFVTGWVMLALLLLWPRYFFPCVWTSLFLILEPINIWRKNRALTDYTAEGDWRPIISLSIGCLICAFFWEMWNFYAYPKWIYRVPFVEFLHIFEMPLLGYGGYIPFSLELFAIYHLMTGLFKQEEHQNFIQIAP